MKSDGRPTVIIPDIHARPELLEAVAERYQGDYQFVLAGDVVDGPDYRTCLRLAREMGAIMLLGNHEWSMLAAMDEADAERRYQWSEWRWRQNETDTLQSYSIYTPPSPQAAQLLKAKMQTTGDYDYVRNASLFFEGPNSDYVVTHAGLTPTTWQQQRIQLIDRNMRRITQNDYGEPERGIPQLFDGGTISAAEIEKRLRKGVTQPKVIRGHRHLTPGDKRIEAGGHLITLASEIREKPYEPLYIYEDWTGKVVEIQAA
jgi:hypothetical protein